MAPEISQVVGQIESQNEDAALCRRAARLMAVLEPRKSAARIVQELLDNLKLERLTREARGLNHWSEHAPALLAQLVREARRRRVLRYEHAEALHKTKHREIVRFARAIVGNESAAEIVAAETYRELLEGAVELEGFFAALTGNARNYLAREAYRWGKFPPLEESFPPIGLGSDAAEAESGAEPLEPPSHRIEDRDPLDILIAREEETERQRLVAAAKRDPRWRYVKRREWAATLREDVRN